MKENSVRGTLVGQLSATDPDNAKNPNTQKLTFLLAEDAGGRFYVNETTLLVRFEGLSLLLLIADHQFHS